MSRPGRAVRRRPAGRARAAEAAGRAGRLYMFISG